MLSLPWIIRHGLFSPISSSARITERMDSSTINYHTWNFLGEMYPVWYFWENTLRTGTTSCYKTSRGSRSNYLQNLTHFFQCPSASIDLLVERPREISFDTVMNPFQKRLFLARSTDYIKTLWVYETNKGKELDVSQVCRLVWMFVYPVVEPYGNCGRRSSGDTDGTKLVGRGGALGGRWICHKTYNSTKGRNCYMYRWG